MDGVRWAVVRLAALWLVLGAASPAVAQVGVSPFKSPRATFTDANGVPLANGCVFTYTAGTWTPLATYTDYTGRTSNPNPITLDSTGSSMIWLGPSTYKYSVNAASPTGNCAVNPGVFQWSVDQVPGNVFLNTTLSGATISESAITSTTYDNGCIGCTVAGPVNGEYFNGPIGTGGGTPAAGSFTSLAAGYQPVGFSSTPAFNASLYDYFSMTLTANVTSSTVTGGQTGQLITLDLCQNATGNFTFAWPANLSGAPAISPASNACTIVQAYYNGAAWITLYNTSTLLVGLTQTVTSSATPVFAAGNYTSFSMLVNQNVVSSTITGGVAGQIIIFNLCQSMTGGFTFAWPSTFSQPPLINTAPNTCTNVTEFLAANGDWYTIGVSSLVTSVGSNTAVLVGNFTTASTSLVTTGLAMNSLPAGTTARGFCNLPFSVASYVDPVNFGLANSAAPSSMIAFAQSGLSAITTVTSVTGTSPTQVDSPTPDAVAFDYTETLNFSITTGSTPDVVTLYASASNASAALTILQGASCGWLP